MVSDELTREQAEKAWERDLQERWQLEWARMNDQSVVYAPAAPVDLLPAEYVVRIWNTGYIIMDINAWNKLPARARKKIEKLCERNT